MDYSIPEEIMKQVERVDFDSEFEPTGRIIHSLSQSVKNAGSTKNPDPIEYLKNIMVQRGMRNKDLKIYIGSSGNVSSVLNRRKPLTLRMIRNLNTYLDIPAEILIQPYKCK